MTEREMNWLKLGLSGCIVAFCMLLAYFVSGKYRSRKNFYTQFARFNELYLTELKYRRKTIGEMFREGRYTGEFQKTIQEIAENRTIEMNYSFLSNEEQAEGKYYFSMLGKGDAHSQTAFFSSQSAILTKKKEACEFEAKERTQLYLKLGLLAGLAFVIMIL